MRRILILEDSQSYVDLLQSQLKTLEHELANEFRVINIQTQAEVEEQVNAQKPDYYDVILLDYYAVDGSFHVLDIEHFGGNKIIAISSVDSKNQLAVQRGVTRTVVKDPRRQGTATAAMIEHVREILLESITD